MDTSVSELFKYIVSGVVNTAAGYGVFWILLRGLHSSPEAANAVGYMVALGIAFLLNRFYVFTAAKISTHTILRFLTSFVAAFAINQGVLIFLIRFFTVLPEIAQLFSMLAYTISFYLFNKYFVFAVNDRNK
jgi:putative flippase GtrA